MTPKEHREHLLQGRDKVCNAIIECLLARGWQGDAILKNIVSKRYEPHSATIRVVDDLEYPQYWVKGEYTSVGHNVLSTCYAIIGAEDSLEEIRYKLTRFIEEAEHHIYNSFAVRFIGDGSRFRQVPEETTA
jgi:hypothetical protein